MRKRLVPVVNNIKDRVRSVERAIDILQVLAAGRGAVGITELSQKTRLPRNTVYRILVSLAYKGIVAQHAPLQKYMLSAKIVLLASGFFQQSNLLNVARPIMESLRDCSGETAALSLLVEGGRICIDQVHSHYEYRIVLNQARVAPLYAGANGKALLAFLPPEELEQYLRETALIPFTPRTVTDRAALESELQEIRQQGFAITAGDLDSNVVSVAAPIMSGQQRPIGTIAVCGPQNRFTLDHARELAPTIMESARRIAVLMRWPHGIEAPAQ